MIESILQGVAKPFRRAHRPTILNTKSGSMSHIIHLDPHGLGIGPSWSKSSVSSHQESIETSFSLTYQDVALTHQEFPFSKSPRAHSGQPQLIKRMIGRISRNVSLNNNGQLSLLQGSIFLRLESKFPSLVSPFYFYEGISKCILGFISLC